MWKIVFMMLLRKHKGTITHINSPQNKTKQNKNNNGKSKQPKWFTDAMAVFVVGQKRREEREA